MMAKSNDNIWAVVWLVAIVAIVIVAAIFAYLFGAVPAGGKSIGANPLSILSPILYISGMGGSGGYGLPFIPATTTTTPQTVTPAYPSPTITVTASGSASAVPSQGSVSLWVNGSGTTTALAAANLSATLAQLNATMLPYVNKNVSLISTQSYSLQKVYNKSAYTATEYISVTLPNVDNVSALLGAVSNIPNVYVSGVNAELSPSQITALRNQALSTALANATDQAQILAQNESVTVKNITVLSSYVPFPFYAAAINSKATGGQIFYNGRSSVQVSLLVVFDESYVIYNANRR